MRNLRRKVNVVDSVEAYACVCSYAVCSCTCACVCACQVGNPSVSDHQSDIYGASNNVTSYRSGDSANSR